MMQPETPATATTPGRSAGTDFLADGYLAHLLSYSLDTLSKEPGTLKSQDEALRQELADTAKTNYQGFIEAASCFHDFSAQVSQVQEQLQHLAGSLQELQSQSAAYASTARTYQAQHQRGCGLLAQHGTLLELLEAPQLIEACVRSGNYDEALDLIASVTKLSVAAPGIPAVQRLVREVEGCRAALLEQLLARLSGPVSLPECLRCVSYLRRLPVFTERELRLRFLSCREAWLQSMIDALDTHNVAEYLRQLTDAYRVHLFDIVMQFRALFSDGDAAGAGPAAPDAGSAAPAREVFGWAHHRVQFYVDRMQHLLPLVPDGQALSSVLEAALYCSRSLARIGVGLEGFLGPVVASAVSALFRQQAAHAVAMFVSSTDAHKWVAMPVVQRRGADDDAGDADAPDLLAEAYPLMSHPPLAVLVNAIVGALSSIRGVALLSLAEPIGGEIASAVHECCVVLASVPSTRRLSASEQAVHQDACEAIERLVCPVLEKAYKQVFTDEASSAPRLSESCVPVQELLASRQQAGAPQPVPPAPVRSPARPTPRVATTIRSAARTDSRDGLSTAAAAPAPAPAAVASSAPPQEEVQESAAPVPAPAQPAQQPVTSPAPQLPPALKDAAASVTPPPAGPPVPAQKAPARAAAGFGGFGADGGSDDDSYTEDAW